MPKRDGTPTKAEARAAIQAEIDTLTGAITSTNGGIDTLGAQIVEINDALDALHANNKAHEAALRDAEKRLREV